MNESTNALAGATQRNLAVELRPHSFDEFIGSAQIINQIRSELSHQRIPTAILLSGPTGCGKTTLARCISQALHGDLTEANAADDTGVDAARDLGERSQYRPLDDATPYKVILLDEAHQLTKQAQNALLKYVEDAPPTTVWILSTTEPTKIIPTLRGRCLSFALQGLAPDGVALLVYRGLSHLGAKSEKTEEFIATLVRENITCGRAVLMATERFAGGMDPLGAVFGTQDAPQAFEIARAVVKADWITVSTALSKITTEEAYAVRMVVVNYMKAVLLKGSGTPAWIAEAIRDLTAISFDNPLGLADLCGRLYTICRRPKTPSK
jgi:DNA polymerase-3 subunit gamma/tau